MECKKEKSRLPGKNFAVTLLKSCNLHSDDELHVVKQDQTVTLTEDDLKALEDAGIDEESLDGKTIEEIKIIAQDSGKKQVVDETIQEQTSVSEEEALKAGGFAGNLIGKTSAELLEIINNQNSYIGTQNEKLANPEKPKEVVSLNQQNLDTEDSTEKETNTAVDLLHLSPEEQEKRLNEIIDKRADARAEKILRDSPEMESVREQAGKNHMVEFHTYLGKQLPEDVSTPEQAEKVFDAWKVAVKDTYTDDELRALAKTPNVLITLISDHYTINHKQVVESDSVTKKVVKKSGEQTFQRIRSMLKDAPAGQAKFNFKRKASEDNESDLDSKEGSDSQQMIGRILKGHLPQ